MTLCIYCTRHDGCRLLRASNGGVVIRCSDYQRGRK